MGLITISDFVVAILVIVVVVLIIRGFWTWYFKINVRVKLMKDQTEVLNKILKTLNPNADIVINEKKWEKLEQLEREKKEREKELKLEENEKM